MALLCFLQGFAGANKELPCGFLIKVKPCAMGGKAVFLKSAGVNSAGIAFNVNVIILGAKGKAQLGDNNMLYSR